MIFLLCCPVDIFREQGLQYFVAIFFAFISNKLGMLRRRLLLPHLSYMKIIFT